MEGTAHSDPKYSPTSACEGVDNGHPLTMCALGPPLPLGPGWALEAPKCTVGLFTT